MDFHQKFHTAEKCLRIGTIWRMDAGREIKAERMTNEWCSCKERWGLVGGGGGLQYLRLFQGHKKVNNIPATVVVWSVESIKTSCQNSMWVPPSELIKISLFVSWQQAGDQNRRSAALGRVWKEVVLAKQNKTFIKSSNMYNLYNDSLCLIKGNENMYNTYIHFCS